MSTSPKKQAIARFPVLDKAAKPGGKIVAAVYRRVQSRRSRRAPTQLLLSSRKALSVSDRLLSGTSEPSDYPGYSAYATPDVLDPYGRQTTASATATLGPEADWAATPQAAAGLSGQYGHQDWYGTAGYQGADAAFAGGYTGGWDGGLSGDTPAHGTPGWDGGWGSRQAAPQAAFGTSGETGAHAVSSSGFPSGYPEGLTGGLGGDFPAGQGTGHPTQGEWAAAGRSGAPGAAPGGYPTPAGPVEETHHGQEYGGFTGQPAAEAVGYAEHLAAPAHSGQSEYQAEYQTDFPVGHQAEFHAGHQADHQTAHREFPGFADGETAFSTGMPEEVTGAAAFAPDEAMGATPAEPEPGYAEPEEVPAPGAEERPAPEAGPTAPAATRRQQPAARRGRRRSYRPRARSAFLSVAAPSLAVLGVTAVATAATVSESDNGGSEDRAPVALPDPAEVEDLPANHEFDTQLVSLSAAAGDYAERASLTQGMLDLEAQREAEERAAEEEAERQERLRPKFFLPVEQHGLSAYFGQAGINWMSVHTGIDFPVSYGTPVLAATDGTIRTQWNASYGNMLILTAPDGTETWYCHLSSTVYQSGSVQAGTVIAYSGNSGNSTGPHLHFEVRPGGGSAIDPLPWLREHGLEPT